MKPPNLPTLAVILALALHACTPKPGASLELKGLWLSTEETSSLFTPGADRVALLLERDSAGALTARALFLKNGEYKMDWTLAGAEYDPDAFTLKILDEDRDTIICILDPKAAMLRGAIHTQDHEQLPLDFAPAGSFMENRLFYPRLPDEEGRISYSYGIPEQIGDGLETESVFRHISDSAAFHSLMMEVIGQEYGKLKSLLILRGNKLLVEEYFYAYGRDDLQQIRSCTKSITSLLLGIALERHPELSLDQSVFDFFPDYTHLTKEGREDISLEHLLTMHAGMEWDDYPGELYTCDDAFAYILSRPLEEKPGTSFHYNSGCSVLLGGVIEYLEATPALDYAREELFGPLGISDFIWESHKKDILQCGHGLSMRPRDMAKAGVLVLNGGKWQDRQIVSEDWIRTSTAAHVRESDYFDYGYQWWHRSNTKLQWWTDPHAASPGEHSLVTALGHGGQFIMIIKDLNMVIVTTASDFEDGGIANRKISMAVDRIVPLFELPQ